MGTVSQCYVEEKALGLFAHADAQDRQGIFNKNVIKSFYTAGLLFDVLGGLFAKDGLDEKIQVPFL
jgi:vacuolar protein sorting-associated protein VTA1